MCWRSLAVTALLCCSAALPCWSATDGSEPAATWQQLDEVWTQLSSESEALRQRLATLSATVNELGNSLRLSENESQGLRRLVASLRAELASLRDSSASLSATLDESQTALQRVEAELTESTASLREARASLRASERSAFTRSVLLVGGGLAGGLLLGLVIG